MITTLAELREYRKANEADKTLRDTVDDSLGYFSNNFREISFEAASKWIREAPEGPARDATSRDYAQTIFKHDPETSMKWIATLPPSQNRDFTLQNIYANWSKDEPTANEAFKQQQRIK